MGGIVHSGQILTMTVMWRSPSVRREQAVVGQGITTRRFLSTGIIRSSGCSCHLITMMRRLGNMGWMCMCFRNRRQTAIAPAVSVWMNRFLSARRTPRDGICPMQCVRQDAMWADFMICAWQNTRGKRFCRHQSICAGKAVSRTVSQRHDF